MSTGTLTLTVGQIGELARFAGFECNLAALADYELESQITGAPCPPEGIANDEGGADHYAFVAYMSDYPEEGCIGLGERT